MLLNNTQITQKVKWREKFKLVKVEIFYQVGDKPD